jgi:hypothetical protein
MVVSRTLMTRWTGVRFPQLHKCDVIRHRKILKHHGAQDFLIFTTPSRDNTSLC